MFRVPTPSDTRKATRRGALSQAPRRPGVVADPGMCRHSLYGNREVSWLTKAACRDWSASGRRGAEADDARPREVRLRHSSGEVAEQNRGTGSGGDGAKGGGRGEREPATHAPDTEPGKRVTDAGARTDGRKVLPSLSEVGAGCGKAARPVLGGGTRVTRFPTAIASCPLRRVRAKVCKLNAKRRSGLSAGTGLHAPERSF